MYKLNTATGRWEDDEEELKKQYEAQIKEQQSQQQKKKKGFFDSLTSGWFKTPEAFKDGFDLSDIPKTLISTGIKGANEFTKGILNIGEGIGDLITYGEYHLLKKTGWLKDYIDPEDLKKEAQKDIFNNLFKESDEVFGKNSVTDTKVDSIVNSLGYMYGLAASAGLGSTAKTQTLISTAVTFESASGHAMTEAYNNGATDKEAYIYGLISGAAEAGSELMFSGIGFGTNATGLTKSAIPLDDMVAKGLSSKFKSNVMKNLTQWVVKSGGEGIEEVISGFFSALGKKHTYMKDKDWNEIIEDEQLFDQFVSGFVSAGISSATGKNGMIKSSIDGKNYLTGRTDIEQQIYDKMIEDKTSQKIDEKNNTLKQKAIDEQVNKRIEELKKKNNGREINEQAIREEITENIEFDDYVDKLSKKEISEINKSVDEAFEKGKLDINDIYDSFTKEETDKIARLKKQLQNNMPEDMRQNYEKELADTINQRNEKLIKASENNDYLRHTLYNEEQKRTNFELTKEEEKLVKNNEKLKVLYEDAKIHGNNSEEAHKFIGALAKMSEQTDYQYRLSTTAELKQLGYETNNKNAVINGLHDGDNKTIYVNMDSDNALNVIVGHETGHIFENTTEYKELQDLLLDIARKDETFETRKSEIEKLYKNIKGADIDIELTNDLLGEKLFTDEKFIERLAEKPNLFTKIKDKIDDLVIKFKGTEEEKQLRKIQNKFLEVYRKNNLQEYVADANAKAKSKTKKFTDNKVDFMLSKNALNDVNEIVKMNQKDAQKSNIQFVKLKDNTIKKLVDYGVPDLPMLERVSHVRENILSKDELKKLGFSINEKKHYHELGVDKYLEIIDSMDNADNVYQYTNEPNVFIIETPVEINGIKSIVPVTIKRSGRYNNVNIEFNKIKTAFTPDYKNYIQNMLNKGTIKEIVTGDNPQQVSLHENNIPQSEQKSKSTKADCSLSQRVSGDKLLDAQDLINEIKSVGAKVDNNGYVTLYHQTTKENAKQIKNSGILKSNGEDYVYFSTSETAQQAEGRGTEKLEFRIPAEKLLLDDIFDDNADLKIALNGKKQIDISDYLINKEVKNTSFYNDLKQKQFDIIKKSNPADDDYHSWIRNASEIKTLQETLEDSDWTGYDEFNPDLTRNDIEKAIDKGTIMVYSSYPIEQGVFVSPSKMEAESYSGDGRVYSKEVSINDVAWIDPTQGQYAKVDTEYSLSNKNQLAPIKGNYQVYSKDIRNNNLAPLREDITKKPAFKNVNYSLSDNYEPTTYDDLEDINKQYEEQPINDNTDNTKIVNPMDNRNIDEVGNRSVKAYQYENPEVKPYYQEMAKYMLNDLDNSVKGERYATDELEFSGTSRQTTDDIAYLLDEYKYSYDDIKKGLNAIIEDQGAENIAVAKRLEILINDRLLNGYTDTLGYDIPANEDYKNLLKEQNQKPLAPIRQDINYSAFDDMLPVKNELERLDRKEQERIIKKREKYQQQIDNAKKISKEKKSSGRKFVDNFKTLFVNENAEIDNLAKESGNTKLTHKADMLNNYVAEAENEIHNYQTDYDGREIGKSVEQLFEQSKKQGLYEAFNDYLINWSNIDRHKQGKGSLRWESTSQDLINQYEAKYPQFKKWAKDVWKYGKNALNTMEQSGLIDSKLNKKLTEMYPHYVPYMDNEDLNKYIGSSDELIPKKTIKTAHGGMSTTQILPIEDALIRYAYSYRKSMRQNDLYSEIVKTLRANEISDVGAGDTRSEVTNLKESLYRDENGNYLKAYINGDVKMVAITDDLYKSLQNDLKNQIKDLEDRLSLVTKPLQTATKIKGNLVTSWNPTFIATNLIKDFQDAIFNSKDTGKFLRNYPSAFMELIKNDTKEVKQFRALYGSGTGQYIGSDIDEKTTNTKKKKGLISKIKSANEIIELAPRYAEFKASLQNGATIEEAMYNAREVTTNFSRGGTITKALNRNGFNFLNASTQGFDKFIRNMSGQNGAKAFTGTLLKALTYGVAPAVFNELVFGSGDDKDEDYDALPDYIKDNYYLFKTKNGEFIRIPKGRALSVFGSAARRTIEYMNGEKDAWDGYLKNTWNQIGFNNPEESFLLTPFKQVKNNKAWYGGDIVPTRLQDKPAGEQYDEKTDLFSKWLGETLNVSPKKINYLLDQYSGAIGDVVLPFITPEATNGYDNPVGRALAPMRDKFVVNSTDDNKYVSDFYTNNDKLKVKANSDYATDEDILRYKYSSSVSSELSKLYKEKRLIQSDTTLSNSEKYKKASAIKKQINEISKEGVKSFNEVNVVGNYGEVHDREFYKNNKGEWTKVKDEDIEEMNKFGLTAREKNNYYNTKNTISSITNKYKELSINATKEEKTELSALKKAEIINSIKGTDITDDAKTYLYNKYYGSDEKMNVISTLGIDINKYLDFELQNFTSDKDANGKAIKNSKKTKMINYINNIGGTYGERIIIYKLNNMNDNTYNKDIVNYVKSQKISQSEKRTILEALGMEVDYAGNVRW